MAGRFIRVACSECDNEQTVFEKASTIVNCSECEEILAEPGGGLATIHGEVLEHLERS